MAVNPFLKENKKTREPIEIYVSDLFVDENGDPVPFVLEIISSKEAEEITQECKTSVIDPQTRRKIGEEIDEKLVQDTIIAHSIKSPDLTDKKTQASWGANNPRELLSNMLDFKEKAILYQEFNKHFEYSSELSQKAEKETKNA